MPLGFRVGGCCCAGELFPLEALGFPFAETDGASTLFTSGFLLAIDSDPGRSVPNWLFYAKTMVRTLAAPAVLSTTLVRSGEAAGRVHPSSHPAAADRSTNRAKAPESGRRGQTAVRLALPRFAGSDRRLCSPSPGW